MVLFEYPDWISGTKNGGRFFSSWHLLGYKPCISFLNRHFGRTYYLHLQGRKLAKQETSLQKVARHNGDDTFLPKRRFTYNLHGFIAKKMVTFITTAVRTSKSNNSWTQQFKVSKNSVSETLCFVVI
jgi:hypothetical protein